MEVRENDHNLGSIDVERDNPSGRAVDFGPFIDTSSLSQKVLEVVGLDGNKRAWRKVLNYRITPAPTPLSGQNLILNFSGPDLGPWMKFNNSPNGWTVKDGSLQIGNGQQYENNVNTDLTLFAQLPDLAYKLSFVAMIDAEKDYDFFSVSIKAKAEKVVELSRISGGSPLNLYEYDLKPFAGKKVEIKLQFTSDGGVTGKGVVLDELELVPQK